MSGSVNKVILIGNLGGDPELKYTPTNRAVCNLSLATNEVFKDKSGQRQERTEWHRIVVWGDTAEACGKYLAKGRSAYIEGRLQTRSWEDKSGGKRYTTEVVADRVVFLGGGGGAGSDRAGSRQTERSAADPLPGELNREPGAPLPGDEGIPF